MSILNRLPRLARLSTLHRANVSRYSAKSEEPPIPTNPLKDTFSSNQQSGSGAVYDTKPFRIHLQAGKKYLWCLCGQSKSQPFCDGTHRNIYLKIKFRPIHFTVTETKDYWLCNCKKTANRPFCDGTHKTIETYKK